MGFPEGTRNNGLFDVGVFLRKKFSDDWEKKLEEKNFQYMKPPLGAADVLTVIKSLSNRDYQYKCNDQPIAAHCNAAVCRTCEDDVSVQGQFKELLESFCTERAQAQSRDELLLGKPWTE